MKTKLLIVAACFWLASFLGGILMGQNERIPELNDESAVRESRKIEDLYNDKQFSALLHECDEFEKNANPNIRVPWIFYMRWLACQGLNDQPACDHVWAEFFRRFPTDPLGANLHFANASEMVVEGKYQLAVAEFKVVENNYPLSLFRKEARRAVEDLQAGNATSTPDKIKQVDEEP